MTNLIQRRVSDQEEIIELKKIISEKDSKINELEKQLAVLPNTKVEDLTEREKTIIAHLEKNPGVSKEWVINRLTKDNAGSRVTINNSIENLKRYEMIRLRKDKPNSQLYKLYLNEDSLFLNVYLDLIELKKAFFNIIEKIKRTNNSSINNTCFYDLTFIYQHVYNTYILYFVLKWQNEINDKLILNKICTIIFYRMIEIQNKIHEVFKLEEGMPDLNEAAAGQVFNPILQEIVSNTFLLRPERIISILKDFGKNNSKHSYKQDIIPLLNIVWKIGFLMYSYADLPRLNDLLPEDMDKLKDWRKAIGFLLHYNKQIKIDKEILGIIGSPPNDL